MLCVLRVAACAACAACGCVCGCVCCVLALLCNCVNERKDSNRGVLLLNVENIPLSFSLTLASLQNSNRGVLLLKVLSLAVGQIVTIISNCAPPRIKNLKKTKREQCIF
jgi:hypothetical protein